MSNKGAVAKGIGGLLVGGLLVLGRFGDDCLKAGRHAPDAVDAARLAGRGGDEVVGAAAQGLPGATDLGRAADVGKAGLGADAGKVGADLSADPDLLRRAVDLAEVVQWTLPMEASEVDVATRFAEEAAARPREQWGWAGGELPDLSGAWCSSISFELDDLRIDVQQRTVLTRAGDGYRMAGSLWVVPDGLFEWERIDFGGTERYSPQEACSTETKLDRLLASPEAHERLKTRDPGYYALLEGQLKLTFGTSELGEESCLPLVVLEPDRMATLQGDVVVPTVRCE